MNTIKMYNYIRWFWQLRIRGVGALWEPSRHSDRFEPDQHVMADTTPDKSVIAADDDLHRIFNAAFCRLSLKWHRDPDTYRDLLHIADEKDRIRTYLKMRQRPLLDAYDPALLVDDA